MLGIGSSFGAYAIHKQIEFLNRKEEEKKRFTRIEVAERYLALYNPLEKIIAQFSWSKNAPRYWAAKEFLQEKQYL